MTTVVHCRRAPYDLYIGRAHQEFAASKWANIFPITATRTRHQALIEYEAYVRANPDLMAALPELRDKVLGCWCKGTAPGNVGCHGDVLVKLLAEEEAEYHANGVAENEAEGRQSEVEHVLPPETRDQAIDRLARQAATRHDMAAGVAAEEILARRNQAAAETLMRQITGDNTDIIPVFSSTYSLGAQSILTLEEAGKTKPGNAASIVDLAKSAGLKQTFLADDRMDGFYEAQRNLAKADIALVFGLKLIVVPDLAQKDDASRVQESTVIVFMRDSAPTPKDTQSPAYLDLVRLHNRAWTAGQYKGYGRIDWQSLKELWTPNLALALPFFSSFLARNTLTFSTITPDLPCAPTVFREVDSELPFAHLIDEAIDRYVAQTGYPVQRVKSVYYAGSGTSTFEQYSILRARENHGTLSSPKWDNLASDRFSFASWKELTS